MSGHRFAVFPMAGGPEAAPAAEADSLTGAVTAVATMAEDGEPGWYVVVDREAGRGEHAVWTYFAPPGLRGWQDLHSVPAHRPWIEAARTEAVS